MLSRLVELSLVQYHHPDNQVPAQIIIKTQNKKMCVPRQKIQRRPPQRKSLKPRIHQELLLCREIFLVTIAVGRNLAILLIGKV